MSVHSETLSERIREYLGQERCHPLLLHGNAQNILPEIPAEAIDVCMTSPPYWQKREYESGGIGLEPTVEEYVQHIVEACALIRRVLKPTGSFWLNLGDSYQSKRLMGIPWRIALRLIDEQGWIMRNDVVWHKLKGPDNSTDKLRNTHEYLFHFVKKPTGYYYNTAAVRARPGKTAHRNGAIVSATGVTGVRYKRQIELSTALNDAEKAEAFTALDMMLRRLELGEVSDFRMVIRKQQRTTHSDSLRLSGRAKELAQKGFYFLPYHPEGSKPGDVWDILPEDSVHRSSHAAPYPEDLCRIPLLATCPPGGVILDPFCGTGTTNWVAMILGYRSIGIDLSSAYIDYAEQRCAVLL